MDLALGAANVAISRAGASSLAEIAAMRLPSLLIPFPAAADNHQFHNARAFETTGAARLLEQQTQRRKELRRSCVSWLKTRPRAPPYANGPRPVAGAQSGGRNRR